MGEAGLSGTHSEHGKAVSTSFVDIVRLELKQSATLKRCLGLFAVGMLKTRRWMEWIL